MLGSQAGPSKKSMWDEILSEYRTSSKNEDKHVLMVGPKFAGKRSILKDLFQMNDAYTGNDSKNKTVQKTVSGIHNDFVSIKNPDDTNGIPCV
jgi:ABC-type phosphate/phosphonate transport system ATPase subunit